MNKKWSLLLSVIVTGIIIVIGNTVIVAQEQKDMTIDAKMKSEVIDQLFKDLNDSYVFPETAKKMETDIRSRLKNGEYEKISSAQEFAKKLTEDLRSVSKDKHLGVRFSYKTLPVRAEQTEPSAEEIANFERFARQTNFGFEKIERMQGNVGYVDLRGFSDPKLGAETVKAVMNFLANTNAIIFDLRQNGGGDPDMVQLISSYLFGEKPVHLNSLYWRKGDQTQEFWTKPEAANVKFEGKDIYVLTANRTFSAAEEFSYNLKNLKRATIVGETTGGGAHPGDMFRLGDHFSAFVPTGRAINPISKTNWEGTGVEPDIKVPKEQALKVAYIAALKKFVEKEKDEDLKNALKSLIEKNQKELGEMTAKN